MAKIFYVVEKAGDYTQCNFFKTEKEALAYGISEFPDFDMFDEPREDLEDDAWFHGDKLEFKKGILFSFEEGSVYVEAYDEDEAREYCSDDIMSDGAAIFFDGFTKGMYGYLGNGADGKGRKWDWDGGRFNESKITKTTMKHVKLFEAFVNEAVNIKKELKKVAKYYDDTEVSDVEVYVNDYVEDENVSSHGYMFWWNAEDQECGIEYQNTPGSDVSDDPCKTADDFFDYINQNT